MSTEYTLEARGASVDEAREKFKALLAQEEAKAAVWVGTRLTRDSGEVVFIGRWHAAEEADDA